MKRQDLLTRNIRGCKSSFRPAVCTCIRPFRDLLLELGHLYSVVLLRQILSAKYILFPRAEDTMSTFFEVFAVVRIPFGRVKAGLKSNTISRVIMFHDFQAKISGVDSGPEEAFQVTHPLILEPFDSSSYKTRGMFM